MKIGVFDSGIGGTSVLEATKKLLPYEEYYYLADSKNCPYGEKSDDELYRIVKANVEFLKAWGARIIVIACNTATTRCIDKLRNDFKNLPFVGTEPAVKLAANSNAKNILVLATPGTITSERLETLVQENQRPGQTITLLACPGLADTIEFNLNKSSVMIEAKLTELFKNLDCNTFDHIVLGCTHYSLIKPEIQTFFPHATLMDGNDGIARRVKSLIKNPLG